MKIVAFLLLTLYYSGFMLEDDGNYLEVSIGVVF